VRPTLQSIEVKAFVPAKDFARSLDFYQAIGFTLASNQGGVAYFHHGDCSFLLQDFHEPVHSANFMMHLLVTNADDWFAHVLASGVVERFGARVQPPQDQPWGMRDFVLFDPTGVLWRIGHNLERGSNA
jgi:uncharacterized glyoxalase superfamily protein PhnB